MTAKSRGQNWNKAEIAKYHEEMKRTHVRDMIRAHVDNIEKIDRGEPHRKFWGCSTPETSRAYSEKQVAYWTAYLMLGHSPNKGIIE